MALDQYKDFQIEEMSMLEVAVELFEKEKNPIDFQDLVMKIAEIKGMSRSEVEQRIAQFYTDLNLDGRFVTMGDNHWGLTRWYPYDSDEEDLNASVKTKKKKKKKALFDDDEFEDLLDDDDYDEIDEDELEEEEEEEVLEFEDLDDDDEEEEFEDDLVTEDEYDLDEDDE